MSAAVDHYNDEYFQSQNAGYAMRGLINMTKFRDFIPENARILDFGCGGGSLLKALGGGVGVEVNPAAAAFARRQGLQVVANLNELEDNAFDVVLSHHALEHVENPVHELRQMARVCRPSGRLIIVVPCDRPSLSFNENDRDMHLYSWSANNIGNLVKISGFRIIQAKELKHCWPPMWQTVLKCVGLQAFHIMSNVRGHMRPARSQVRVVAELPPTP